MKVSFVPSIIIVSYNTRDFLRDCLSRIPKGRFETIVVDNGSTDGSCEMCRREFPNVKLIENGRNVGFARANNIGARVSNGSVLIFLNSDTLPDPGVFDVLLKGMDHYGADIVGPRLVFPNGVTQTSSARRRPTPNIEFLRNVGLVTGYRFRLDMLDDYGATEEVDVISGACLVVKRDVFNKIGGWPEEYFMYGEDLELCLKARNAGFRLFYIGSVSLIHIGGGSSSQNLFRKCNMLWSSCVSTYKFLLRHYGMMAGICYIPQIPIRIVGICCLRFRRSGRR